MDPAEVEEPKAYTVFSMSVLQESMKSLAEDAPLPDIITMPNDPSPSLDGSKAIATGIFEDAPGAEFLSQSEAEALIGTAEWSTPNDPVS